MAIKDKGYGESGTVGFDDMSERDDNGKATAYRQADKLPVGDHVMEVVFINIWEKDDSTDMVKIWFARSGKLTAMLGKYTSKVAWKWDRAFRSIFGGDLPHEQLQGAGGKMPLATRTAALGRWVMVRVEEDEGYDKQNVLVLDGGPYAAPKECEPMYEYGTDKATGDWPTKAADMASNEAAPYSQTRGQPATKEKDEGPGW